MQINDGGPAYPSSLRNESTKNILGLNGETVPARSETFYGGMSLRDHFAGLAMQGMVSSSAYESGCWEPESIVEQAYQLADHMIRARTQEQS